jgi:hypothetical protein
LNPALQAAAHVRPYFSSSATFRPIHLVGRERQILRSFASLCPPLAKQDGPSRICQELPLGKVRARVTFGGPNKIMWRVEVSLEVVDGFDAFFVGQIADGGKFLTEGLSEQFLVQGLRDQRLGCGSFHNSNSLLG